MAYVAPFRALRYDPARVSLPAVVTQPYDKITLEMQERYQAASPYNLVRIILGPPQPTDTDAENCYTRAAAYFHDWRRQGILVQDPEPSIYSYSQQFTVPGTTASLTRSGFIALGRVEDYAAGVVFRHEQTLARPKADRLDLLRATRAHFGQIFMLYSDPAGDVQRVLEAESADVTGIRDEYGVRHSLRRIADTGLIRRVCAQMRDRKLIIADGHHRYETALNYRNQCRASAEQVMPQLAAAGPASAQPAASRLAASPAPASSEATAYDFVMMTFINMDSPGVLILPTHRVVHSLPRFSPEEFRQQAKSGFSVEEVDPAITAARATALLREAGRTGTALLAVTANRAFLLDRPGFNNSAAFTGYSLRQQALDVVQLHKRVLEGVLGLSEESIREQQNITYVRDAAEALEKVRSGAANIAFLMNPVRIEQVRDIAFAGEVLPQKSTDFYPKLLSGLTIYALE
jgi:uncharacterized protein (DUF1015 family)